MSGERVRLGRNPAGVEIVCQQIDGEALVSFLERAQLEAEDLVDVNAAHAAALVRLLEAEAARIGAQAKLIGTDADRIAEHRQDSADCKIMAGHIRAGDSYRARRLFSSMHNPELILPSEVTKWIESRGGRLA
jgi:hypothetical protein